jgi:sec-independent protein translocase protein TatA
MWDAPWHWVVLAIVVIALFYYRRLPDAARSLGRSLRIFKTEIKGMGEDDKKRAQAAEEPKAIEPTPAPQAALPRPRPTPKPQRVVEPVPGAEGSAKAE